MLIMLGGIPGSGRRKLSQGISLRHGIHPHDINRWKPRSFLLDTDGEHRILHPQTDAELASVYVRALAEFPRLSKMHKDIIVENAFHRAGPRDLFIREAGKYYSPVVFVWAQPTSEEWVRKNLSYLDRKKLAPPGKTAAQLRARTQRMLEPPNASVPVFDPTNCGPEEVEALWKLIQSRVSGKN